MKLFALLKSRGVSEVSLFLAIATAAGLLEGLVEVALLWGIAMPGGGPTAAIGYFGFVLLLGLMFFVRWAVQARVAGWFAGVVADIRRSLLERVYRIEPSAWERVPKERVRLALSALPSRLNGVAGNLANAIAISILALMLTLYALSLYWPVGVVVLFSYIGVGAYLVHLQGALSEVEGAAHQADEALRAGLQELVYGRKELLLDREKSSLLFNDMVRGSLARRVAARVPVRTSLLRYTMLYESSEVVLGFIAVIIYTLVPHAPGDLGPLVALLMMYVVPYGMFRVASQLISGEAAATQLADIEDVLAAAARQAAPPSSAAPVETSQARFQSLVLTDTTYSYADSRSRFRIGPVNLHIEQGTITFITGENGGGKSTLVKLLLGVYQPRGGTILLNGEPADMRQHRGLFAFVAADHVLFDELFGYADADPVRVNALLAHYGVGHLTRYENGRFSRLNLSSGQRKRVGLAVAVVEDKPILVLDEFAAEQDRAMRERFYHEILPALRAEGRTVIAVTHDDRYFHACDQLVMMRDGNIRYAGSPEGAPLHHPVHAA